MTRLPWRIFWLSGRADRKEFAVVIGVVVAAITAALSWQIPHGPPGDYLDAGSALAMVVFFTAIALGGFAVCRRLQDLGADTFLVFWILIVAWAPDILARMIGGWIGAHSVWFSAVTLVVCLIVLGTKRGAVGDNKYGPDPRAPKPSPRGSG